MNLSQSLQISLSVALSEAARLGHEYAGVEHLLYAFTLDRGTAEVLRHSGANLEALKRRLATFLTEELDRYEDEELEPRLGLGVRHALARASAQVAGSGRDEVRGADVLVALFAEPDTFAINLLDEQGVSRLDVISYLSHGVSRLSGTGPGGSDPSSDSGDGAIGEREGGEDDDEEGGGSPGGDPLQAFCQELTALAKKGAIDPLIGREREVERTLHILQRRRKNNPIYVGDPQASASFDPASYVDVARFGSLAEALEFVREVDHDRSLHLKMLATPWYRGNEVPRYARDETIAAFFDRIFAAALARRSRSDAG